MKKSNYISIGIMVFLTILGIYVGKFYGGMLAGAALCALIVVTVGKIAYHKAMKRQDSINEAIRRTMRKGEGM